jgi:epoxyqueuosine reductase
MHPEWAWQESPKYGLASNWSQRHVAYIAGLGTFGLCEGLITRQGKAVRFTSLILETRLPADIRPYADYQDWCLYFAKGSCPSCIKACPAGAIDENGHHKELCIEYITDFKNSYRDSGPINADGPFGCGLCQGKVPCQSGVPKGLDKQQ